VAQADLLPAASEQAAGNISMDPLVMRCSHNFILRQNPYILSTLRGTLYVTALRFSVQLIYKKDNNWQFHQSIYALIINK
jgi:hypothetical protein